MKFSEWINEEIKRTQEFKKYIVQGNSFKPVGNIKTINELDSGIYSLKNTMDGVEFEVHDIKTDKLLRFEDERYTAVMNEIADFWKLKEDFSKMGFNHKRGMLLYGTPGSGKTCLLKLVIEDSVKQGNVVLIAKNPNTLVTGLKQLKEIESNRKVLVILEDVDEIVRYNEHAILELFDGPEQVSNVLFLCTTNYPERLPQRIMRENRLDRKIEIGNPPLEGRLAYLNIKLKEHEDDNVIQKLAEKTKGFSFAQLREFLVSTYCMKQDIDTVINRIRKGYENHNISEAELDKKLNAILSEKPKPSSIKNDLINEMSM
jgi:SpoVK/Ycf46/Vps4 family AAA+-type ATPase